MPFSLDHICMWVAACGGTDLCGHLDLCPASGDPCSLNALSAWLASAVWPGWCLQHEDFTEAMFKLDYNEAFCGFFFLSYQASAEKTTPCRGKIRAR